MHEAVLGGVGYSTRLGSCFEEKAFPRTVSRSFAFTGLLDAPEQFGGSCRLN